MAFFLFILVNATLFLRPAELVPDLKDMSIYEALIITCFVFAIPEVIAQLLGKPLLQQPVLLCVFGALAAAFVAHVPTANIHEAWRTGFAYAKVVVFFVLFVSVVNTPARLRVYVMCLIWFCALLAAITILQFHEVITLPTFKTRLREQDVDPVTGEAINYFRLQGSGVFADPNELGSMLALAVPLALYWIASGRASGLVAMLPLSLFAYGISLTRSRGALLALLAGIGGMALARFGGKRAGWLAVIAFPVFFAFFAGRQTSLSATQGTAQSRVQHWSEWLGEFQASPVFGKGITSADPDQDASEKTGEKRLLAHNSYLQAFADLGFFGGMCFLGAFAFALAGPYYLRPSQKTIVDPELARLRPYLLGGILAYEVGMLSLSVNFIIPPYISLGLGMAFTQVARTQPPQPPLQLDWRRIKQLVLLSIAYLAAIYVFVRLFVRW
jgi:O-antigen ligase